MVVTASLKLLCLIFCVLVKESKSKKIIALEKRLNVLEQKFGIQAYENILMKDEMNKLKNMMLELTENITSFVKAEDINIVYKTNTKGEFRTGDVDIADMKQKVSDVVQITKLLLNAFRAEKQERINLSAELESLRKTGGGDKKQLNMLKENLEEIQKDLQTQKNMNRQDKEEIRKEIEELKDYKKSMEEASVDLKVLNNENAISELATKYHRFADAMEVKCSSAVTNIAEIAGQLKLQQISFSARLSGSIENLNPWETVVFNRIITNTGNAYSTQTGIFTAPVPGVYVFYTHILAVNRNMEMSLQRNGGNVMYLYVSGNAHGADGNLIVISLNKGDEIKVVKHGHYGQAPFYVHPWSTFSGYLLHT